MAGPDACGEELSVHPVPPEPVTPLPLPHERRVGAGLPHQVAHLLPAGGRAFAGNLAYWDAEL